MNALSLRGFVKSRDPTHREEEGEESDAFLAMFGGNLVVTQGGTETVSNHHACLRTCDDCFTVIAIPIVMSAPLLWYRYGFFSLD